MQKQWFNNNFSLWMYFGIRSVPFESPFFVIIYTFSFAFVLLFNLFFPFPFSSVWELVDVSFFPIAVYMVHRNDIRKVFVLIFCCSCCCAISISMLLVVCSILFGFVFFFFFFLFCFISFYSIPFRWHWAVCILYFDTFFLLLFCPCCWISLCA